MNIPLTRYWRLLAGYLLPQWPRVALLGCLLLSSIGLELANPLILRYFIDSATAGAALGTLTGAAGLFIGLAVLTQAVTVAETYVAENVGWTATNTVRGDLALHLLKLDASFHTAHTSGQLIERIDGDVTQLANFFSRFIVYIVGNVLLMVGVLLLLLRIDWRVGLGLGFFVIVALAVMLRIRSLAVPYWTEVRATSATFFGFLGEYLAGTEDIRSSGATPYVLHRFSQTLRPWLRIQQKAGVAGYAMVTTSLLLFALGNAIAFALGASLFTAGSISLGTVYLIFQYTELLRRPTEAIRRQIQDLQQADASIGRVERLFQTRSTIDGGAGIPLAPGALSVQFDHVSFAYGASNEDGDEGTAHEHDGMAAPSPLPPSAHPPSSLVLHDVSFRLQPGEVLGLLGRTGSGKTTLTRLLLRFYDPIWGTVRLGGVDVREAGLAALRGRIGMVTQEVQLFHATVRDNLTLFDGAIDDSHLRAALAAVGLQAWLEALPAGLETPIAPGGGGLSAGEAQLLAFARVFLRDPGLVILDEATSRLDPVTETLVHRAMVTLLAGRTAIIVAHRLATIEHASRIVILDGGQIAETGPRLELAADPASRFYALLHSGSQVLA